MSQLYIPMHKILRESKSGDYQIKKRKITKQDVKQAELRAIFDPRAIPPEIGTLTILSRKTDSSWKEHDVVMSDAEFV